MNTNPNLNIRNTHPKKKKKKNTHTHKPKPKLQQEFSFEEKLPDPFNQITINSSSESMTQGFEAWCTPSDSDHTDSFSSSEACLACKQHHILSLTLPSVVYRHILISHLMEYNIFLAMSSNLVLAVANQTLWWQTGPWQAMITP